MGIRVQKDQLWYKVQGSLREKLGAQNFEIWIRPIQMASISGNSVNLEVPNKVDYESGPNWGEIK